MQLLDITHSLAQAELPDLETLRDRYGWTARTHRIFDRMFGLQSTSLHPEHSLRETLLISAAKLAARNPALLGNVDLLVYCHALNSTIPLQGDALRMIAREVFDSAPEILSVTQGSCASAILALHLLRHLPPTDRPRNIVLLTGEKCFFELLDYADNNGLFGETTSAVWLTEDTTPRRDATRIVATNAGAFAGVWAPLARADKETAANYDRSFIPKMQAAVEAVMAEACITSTDIGIVLPTHLSPFTFNRVSERLGIPDGRVIKQNLTRIGHCFCGDLFINYKTWLQGVHRASAPVHVLSFAAGMTGSYAAIILQKDYLI